MNQHHPDDELLSAALDGETDPDTVAHVGGCDACMERLDALDRVRQAVAADPGPAPATVADRALAAATAAWVSEQAAVDVPEPAPTVPVPTPTPTPRTGAAPSTVGAGAAGDHDVLPLHRRSDQRRFPTWALGAVAALVAVLLAVPIALNDDSDSAEQTASAPTADVADEASSLDAGVVEGGELGSLSDPATLREQLLQAVPRPMTEAAPPPPTEGAADTLAAPAAGAPTTTEFAARNAGGAGTAGTTCRAEVRAQFGERLGALLYAASLRWQDNDAVVLAYRLADTSAPGPDHLALVMARDGCRLLASQGF